MTDYYAHARGAAPAAAYKPSSFAPAPAASSSSSSTTSSALINLAVHEAAVPSSTEQIIITDKASGARYLVGPCLGKGGFAKCYELTNIDTGAIVAGKIVSKQTLAKHRAKEKVLVSPDCIATVSCLLVDNGD